MFFNRPGGDAFPLLQLPSEILLHILSLLTLPERVRMSEVCHVLHQLCQDKSLWRVLKVDKHAVDRDKLSEYLKTKRIPVGVIVTTTCSH